MNLRRLAEESRKVRIVNTNGDEFFGEVGDYIWPDDNDVDVEAIILDNPDFPNPLQFDATDIKFIEVIE